VNALRGRQPRKLSVCIGDTGRIEPRRFDHNASVLRRRARRRYPDNAKNGGIATFKTDRSAFDTSVGRCAGTHTHARDESNLTVGHRFPDATACAT